MPHFPSMSSMSTRMLDQSPAYAQNDYLAGPQRDSSKLRTPHYPHFPAKLPDESHISDSHDQMLPFKCPQCGKGYQTHTGLMHHVQAHKGKTFMCPVCDTKFTQKFTIKKHLRTIHNSAQCVTCQVVFKIGQDFDHHVINCNGQN